MLLEHAVDGGAGDKVALRQLAETVAPLTVPQDSVAIKNKWFTSDVAAFELGPPHGRTRSMMRLRSSSAMAPMMTTTARPTAAGVDLLAEADELDVEPAEFVSTSRKCRTDRAMRSEAQTRTTSKRPAAGVAHHGVESRTLSFGSTDSVGILLDDLIATLLGHLAEVIELGLGVLIEGRDSHIEGGAFHRGS